MSFEQIITDELKKAIKSGDKIRLGTIRSIRASIIEFNKSGADREMNKEDELKILNLQAKRRKEAIEMYEKGGRDELAETEKIELAVIQEFLPEMMSDDEVKKIIAKIVAECGANSMKDFGKVMGMAMKELKGKADGSIVQQTVKKILSAE